MNVIKLKEWSQSSPEATAMYTYIASRKRGTRGGKPSDLKHIVMRLLELGFTLSAKQVEAELEKLEAMGLGSLERKANRQPKWKWANNPAAVAKALTHKATLVKTPIATSNGPGIMSERRVIRITRGDTMIEANPEDLAKVLMAIGMR